MCHFRGHGLRRKYKLVHRGHYLGRRNASSRPPPWERPPETPSAAAAPPSPPPRLCLWHWQTVAVASAAYVVAAAAPPTSHYLIRDRWSTAARPPRSTSPPLQLPPTTPDAAPSVETTSSVNRPAALSAVAVSRSPFPAGTSRWTMRRFVRGGGGKVSRPPSPLVRGPRPRRRPRTDRLARPYARRRRTQRPRCGPVPG